MGWERRGGFYYYVRRKTCGKVIRTFMGRGAEAEVAASLEQLRRQHREQERQRRRAEQARWDAADAALARVVAATQLLMRAALRGAGFHQHQRGEWRLRRGRRRESMPTQQTTLEQLSVEEREHLCMGLGKAQEGDRSVIDELQAALDRHAMIWERTGDLSAQALSLWLSLAAGDNLLLRASLERTIEAMRLELAGPAPSLLEELLVGRVLICHLQVGLADIAAGQARSGSVDVHRLLLKRMESAQRRLLQAIQALTSVRRLLRPACSPRDIALHQAEETPSLPFPHAARQPRPASVAN
jgi:hypothetical protein